MPVILSFRPSYDRLAFDETFYYSSSVADSPDYGPFHPALGKVPRDATVLYTLKDDDEDNAKLGQILSKLATTVQMYPDPPTSVRAPDVVNTIRRWEQDYTNWFRELILPTFEIILRMSSPGWIRHLGMILPWSPNPPPSTPFQIQSVAKLMLSHKICKVFREFHKRWSVFRRNFASKWCLTREDWAQKLLITTSTPFTQELPYELSHIPEIKVELIEMRARVENRAKEAIPVKIRSLKRNKNTMQKSDSFQEAPALSLTASPAETPTYVQDLIEL